MKKTATTCNMETCFLCKHSLEGWTSLISSHKKNFHFKKGASIFEEGQPVTGIFFLYEGIVKVHKQWETDKELILHFAKKGDMIGYRGLGDMKLYPVSATALDTVTVCFIELPFFESSLKVNHTLTLFLLKFYINELHDAENRMRNLAHMDVKGRLMEALTQLKKKFGVTKEGFIKLTLSRQNLASYTGTTYETLFRVMQELVKGKNIKLKGKHIRVLKELK